MRGAGLVFLVILCCWISSSSSAIYQQCSGGKHVPNIDKAISVSSCTKVPCRLRKRTQSQIEMKFTPETEVKSLTNTVYANIVGIPFPFIGVDNTNACNSIYEGDGTTKASCPLQAGKQYVYKNKIDVLDVYPRVKVVVHWALTSPSGDVICFEVPARITN